MNILKKQLLLLFLLLTTTTYLAGNPTIQLPEDMISVAERIRKDVKAALQSKVKDLYQECNTAKDFKNKKNNLIKGRLYFYLRKEMAILVVIVSLCVSIFVGFKPLANMIKRIHEQYGRPSAEDNASINNLAYTLVITMILFLIGFLLKSVKDTWTMFSLYRNPEELYESVAAIEDRYMAKKETLRRDGKENHIKVIESLLVNIRLHPKRYDLIKQVTALLDLVKGNSNDGRLVWDKQRIDKALKGLKPHIVEQLEELLFLIYTNVNLSKLKEKDKDRILLSVLFTGPPGVGKSYLARLVAILLGLPSFEINMSRGSDNIFGVQNQKQASMTASIASSMSKKHGRYAICILEDADRKMISQKMGMATDVQLNMLDEDKKFYYDAFLDVLVTKSIATIVTANYAKKLGTAPLDRFSIVIDFEDPYNKEGKHMFLEKYMHSYLKERKGLHHSLTKQDFTKQEWHHIKEDAIKEAKLQKDTLRALMRYIRKYFNKKAKQKHDAMLEQISMNNQKKNQRAVRAAA